MRCRKLAWASPKPLRACTQGLKASAQPKYCKTPIALLAKAAMAQDWAMSWARRAERETMRRPTHDQVISSGTTLGKGLVDQGCTQGRTNKKPRRGAAQGEDGPSAMRFTAVPSQTPCVAGRWRRLKRSRSFARSRQVLHRQTIAGGGSTAPSGYGFAAIGVAIDGRTGCLQGCQCNGVG